MTAQDDLNKALAELKNQIQQGAALGTDNTIGVPKDYKAPTHLQHTQYGDVQFSNAVNMPAIGKDNMGGLYVNGDEWGPQNDPATIPRILAELVNAGLLKKSDYRSGVFDGRAAAAYKTVLAYANANGIDGHTALDIMASHPPLGTPGPQGPSNQLPVAQLSNPEDVSAAFQGQAQNMVGGGLTNQENLQFQQDYRGQENQAYLRRVQTEGTNAKPGPGGTYQGAPAPDAAAKDFILSHNQPDIVNYDMALRTIEFGNALKEL